MLHLFSAYPRLRKELPYVSLGEFPTPVHELAGLEAHVGSGRFYIKHDGLSGNPYGGNKVRKLELILGNALRKKAKEVITFGFAGSNHALATAVYARKVGLKCTLMLMPQINARHVRRNLLLGHVHGADLRQYPGVKAFRMPTSLKIISGLLRHAKLPYIVAPGGSSPLGTIGYVNAAFELKAQIEQGEMPEPDRIVVPLGTMGTSAGLQLGLRAAGLRTQLISVRVVDRAFANEQKFLKLYLDTLKLLRSLDPSFPDVIITQEDIDIRHGFYGGEYARFTPEGTDAARMLWELDGIKLEGTYTGKAMAALLEGIRPDASGNETTLFWGTYNARDFSDLIRDVDYHELPECFHRYFEEDVQPLDRED